jgi:hypothetical protein
MFRYIILLQVFILPFVTYSQTNLIDTTAIRNDSFNESEEPDSIITILWNTTVKPNLDSSLWQKGSAYNAGHFYMVPLHAAFEWKQELWQRQFSGHFERFVHQGLNDVEPVRLYRLQYYYLASWYMILSSGQKSDSALNARLFQIIHEELKNIWTNELSWMWSNTFLPIRQFDNMRSRILWKLYNVDLPPKTYFRAIVDEEKFVFAIAANLKSYLKQNQSDTMPANEIIDDILRLNKIVWQRRTEWNEHGGWLFQPGFWSNHPDYWYAGNFDKTNPKVSLVENIAEDVSHSHRTALWLRSFMMAATEDEEYSFFDSLLVGLDNQFFNYVLVYPTDSVDTYLTYNYMNGWNGLYRWNYFKNEPNTGYGPYELSGTMLLGWWTFLGTERIKKVYQELSNRFPIPEPILSIYEMRTGQPRPPDRKENFYTNGLGWLICLLAARLNHVQ